MGDSTPRQDLGNQPGRFRLGSEKRGDHRTELPSGPALGALHTWMFSTHAGSSLRHTAGQVTPASQVGRQQRRTEDTMAKLDSNPLLVV